MPTEDSFFRPNSSQEEFRRLDQSAIQDETDSPDTVLWLNIVDRVSEDFKYRGLTFWQTREFPTVRASDEVLKQFALSKEG